MRHSEGRRCVALGIGIDNEDVKSGLGQCSCNIHRRRRLTDPALLVGNSNDTSLVGVRKAHPGELFKRRVIGLQLFEDGRSRQNCSPRTTSPAAPGGRGRSVYVSAATPTVYLAAPNRHRRCNSRRVPHTTYPIRIQAGSSPVARHRLGRRTCTTLVSSSPGVITS